MGGRASIRPSTQKSKSRVRRHFTVSKARPTEPGALQQLDDNPKHKHWQILFHIREWLIRVFDPASRQVSTYKQLP